MKKTSPPKKKKIIVFWLWFSSDSAFKTIDIQMFFWSVFLKMQKKYWLSKTLICQFLVVNHGFFCIFKNTDKNNICVPIVLKAKTEEKNEFWNINRKKMFFIFFFYFSFKNKRCTNVILISIFENARKKLFLTGKNGQNGVFGSQ